MTFSFFQYHHHKPKELTILIFFQHFYHVLTCLRRPQGSGLELARKHIASCTSELEIILSSSEFLKSAAFGACEDGIKDKTTASGCQPIGFDASSNCRLSAPTPPRAIKILSWEKVRIHTCTDLVILFHYYHNFFFLLFRLWNTF